MQVFSQTAFTTCSFALDTIDLCKRTSRFKGKLTISSYYDGVVLLDQLHPKKHVILQIINFN